MKKKIISLICLLSFLICSIAFAISASATETSEASSYYSGDVPLRLWYNEPAPITDTENNPVADGTNGGDDGWEQWSLPIGNGYFGANVFGRTESERIQITDKTLANPQYCTDSEGERYQVGGLNNFSETYIDFGHTDVSDYVRYLDIKTAISGVDYTYNNVKYTREYFTSYPDKALVIRLSADTEDALSFTLRPTIPFEQSYSGFEGDGITKSGTVMSSVENGVGYIELSGKLGYYDIDFLGIYKVYTNGGTVSAAKTEHTYYDTDGTLCTDVDGTIVVSEATDAYIVVTLGTDYELVSETFSKTNAYKPTKYTDLEYTRAKVEADMEVIDEKIAAAASIDEAYASLKKSHIEDYDELFGRVSLNLGVDSADFNKTTDALLEDYKEYGSGNYLENLFFQYGRYLLIASSREGTMPSNLQGAWNAYNIPPWSSGYWHNINVQMNYWHAFSTNIAETFKAYIAFNDAYMQKAEANADIIIEQYYSSLYDEDGGNGWCIGTGANPFGINMDRSSGNLGFTTQLYWEYYEYTLDDKALEKAYEILVNAAKFITKIVSEDGEGNYLVDYCDSPEVHVDGIWYYTVGTTYAQTFAYLNNYNALKAASLLGIDLNDDELLSTEDYSILKTVMKQIDKYDPVHVGLSGQIKEFREEDYYGSIGDDPNHRHISQLVGLYPGNLINATTPAWLDAAKVTLENRGGNTTGGWVYAHKAGVYARAKDGENAHARIQELFTNSLCQNLFTKLWQVYQIDANFGTTAAIAEMLLQSHEGYIEPLAAMPSEWSSGSYTGLVARGNFEVSAAWEDGVAKTFHILSNKGGEASVYYPTITGASVINAASGEPVDCTVSGKNLISFDTEEGQTYIISGFSEVNAPDAPESLNYTRADFGSFNLAWSATSGAVKYNVYVAVENDPDYTLVASTDKLYAKYTPAEYEENARTTFAVVAVGANGEESERVLCYYNPVDTSAYVTDVHGSVNKNGELQVIVDANENAAKYRLYEKASGEDAYSLIYESGFPLLYSEVYNDKSEYAISVASYFDGVESELYAVKSLSGSAADYDASNIFTDKVFTQESGTAYNALSGYGYEKLTDGIIDTESSANGRYSSVKGNSTAATIDLGGTYILSEIRFYIYNKQTAQVGTNFTLEVYSNGIWVNIFDEPLSNETLVSEYVKTSGSGRDSKILTFDLGCIRGNKIRYSTEAYNGNYITFYEAECSGLLLDGKYAVSENILVGKEFIGTEPTIYSENAGGDVFTYDKLTDGIISSVWNIGRFSSTKNGKANGTVDLGGLYNLHDIRFYDFAQDYVNAGQNFKIDLYYNGAWTNAVTVANNDDFAEYRVSVGDGYSENWLAFNLEGALAEKIRFTADAVSDNYITLYEIECSGTLVYEYGDYNENLLLNKTVIPGEDATTQSDQYDYRCLTDGSFDKNTGRFSTSFKGLAAATINLDGEYVLTELRFYEYISGKNAGYPITGFTVEILSNGSWIKLVDNVSFNDLAEFKSEVKVSNVTCYEFKFPIDNIKAEGIRFFGTSGYFVSFHEIECSGYEIPVDGNENSADNLLESSEASISASLLSGTLNNLTDGDLDTAISLSGASYSVEFDFGAVKRLYTLKIYELLEDANLIDGTLSTASDDTTVEIYRNNAWIRVVDKLSLNAGGFYTKVDLYGIECSKVRITFTNTRLFDSESEYRSAKISEISCTAGYDSVDFGSMIAALEKLPEADIEENVNNRYLYNENYKKFKTYAANSEADQETIDLYTAEIEEYYADISSTILSAYNISLGGDIAMNFRYRVIDLTLLSKYPDAYVEFVTPTKSGSEITKVYLKDAEVDSEGRYIFSVYLAAAQMNDKVTLYMVYDENTVGKSFETSVREYVDHILASDDAECAYPGIGELLKAMLNYGAYAQSYFGYNESSLANDGIENNVEATEVEESSVISVIGEASAITSSGWKIALLSKTTMRIYFTPDDGYSETDFNFVLVLENGNRNEVKPVYENGRYRIDIEDIGAAALDDIYTVEVSNVSDSTSCSISVSALCYVSAVLNGSHDADLINLVKALKLYNEAANAYVEKN